MTRQQHDAAAVPDVVARQADAIGRFAAWCDRRIAVALTGSREEALDRARERDVILAIRQAVADRVDRGPDGLSEVRGGPTALVAHRDGWFSRQVSAALADAGVWVVASVGDGAQAVGACIALQPDLVLMQDLLPMLPGPRAVEDVLRWCPTARIAAQVDHPGGMGALLDAGAHDVFTRREPPAAAAARLVGLLRAAS